MRLDTQVAHLVAPEHLHGRCASLHHRLAVDQKSGCTDGNVLFCALIYIYIYIYNYYVDIILLILNKREKSEAK